MKELEYSQLKFLYDLRSSAYSGQLYYRYWKPHATRRSSYRILYCMKEQQMNKVIGSLAEYHMNHVQQLRQNKLQNGVVQCLRELNQWNKQLKELRRRFQAMIKQEQLKQYEQKIKQENQIQKQSNKSIIKKIFSFFWRKQKKINIVDSSKKEQQSARDKKFKQTSVKDSQQILNNAADQQGKISQQHQKKRFIFQLKQ